MPLKKVLAIIYTPSFGGPHNQIKQLDSGFLDKGFKYSLCVPKSDQSYQKEFSEKGIDLYFYEPSRIRYSNAVYHLIKYLLKFPIDVYNYVRIIKNSNCDVVQICGLMCLQSGIAAKICGKPIVWQLLSTFAPLPLRFLFMPFVAILSSKIMTIGTATARQHPFYRLWKSKFIPFYPPVKDNIFKPSNEERVETRKKFGFSDTDLVIGTLGNKNRQKNHAAFINLIIAITKQSSKNNIRYVIAGRENPEFLKEYEKTVRAKAKAHNLFEKGVLLETDSSLPVHKILNAFDVFILTSISEGTPTVIIEALACGKPVIAPNVGSIKEMLEGNPFCLVYDTLDSNAVHTQILKITDAPKAEVVETCVEHFNRLFSYDTCVNAHIVAFK